MIITGNLITNSIFCYMPPNSCVHTTQNVVCRGSGCAENEIMQMYDCNKINLGQANHPDVSLRSDNYPILLIIFTEIFTGQCVPLYINQFRFIFFVHPNYVNSHKYLNNQVW